MFLNKNDQQESIRMDMALSDSDDPTEDYKRKRLPKSSNDMMAESKRPKIKKTPPPDVMEIMEEPSFSKRDQNILQRCISLKVQDLGVNMSSLEICRANKELVANRDLNDPCKRDNFLSMLADDKLQEVTRISQWESLGRGITWVFILISLCLIFSFVFGLSSASKQIQIYTGDHTKPTNCEDVPTNNRLLIYNSDCIIDEGVNCYTAVFMRKKIPSPTQEEIRQLLLNGELKYCIGTTNSTFFYRKIVKEYYNIYSLLSSDANETSFYNYTIVYDNVNLSREIKCSNFSVQPQLPSETLILDKTDLQESFRICKQLKLYDAVSVTLSIVNYALAVLPISILLASKLLTKFNRDNLTKLISSDERLRRTDASESTNTNRIKS